MRRVRKGRDRQKGIKVNVTEHKIRKKGEKNYMKTT